MRKVKWAFVGGVSLIGLSLVTHNATGQETSDVDAQTKQVALDKAKVDLEAAKMALQKAQLSATAGTTAMASGAGIAEEMILSDNAIKQLAAQTRTFLDATSCKGKTIVIYVDSRPSRAETIAFDSTVARLKQEYLDANALLQQAIKDDPAKRPAAGERTPLVAVALVALSLLKTDYQIGGAALTLEQQQFALAVIDRNALKKFLLSSEMANWGITQSAINDIQKNDFTPIGNNATAAQAGIALAAKRAKTLGEDKPVGAEYALAGGALAAYLDDVKAFRAAVAATDSNGLSLLVRVASEKALAAEQTRDAYCRLSTHLSHGAGSQYTKSNIFTVFGGVPFYSSAYVAGSILVWDGNLQLVNSALLSSASGFKKLDDVTPQ